MRGRVGNNQRTEPPQNRHYAFLEPIDPRPEGYGQAGCRVRNSLQLIAKALMKSFYDQGPLHSDIVGLPPLALAGFEFLPKYLASRFIQHQ